ncbi:glycosyltransferase family 2 protein [Nostoc sp. CENA67]|uniref:Glycosyltransferase family 2 protein n=1 Tax=Amazonocrinis nigriterrae CENA67 TaxID=2794033 RepID=A0A8J7HTX6_9NOST|nr:glycosyltransferase [Amazonocrinis nigriterrae]MBH8563673.1 glycosyltransferase family 2 protein [Amazonocrinis nigriterrae CENA67]
MDIIICTYNNAALLERTLAAISRQKVSQNYHWTVTVVDNNCVDETPAIVEKFIRANTIPGLHRIVEKRQGLTYARICGITNTTSEWIAFVDDDCVISEDWVENAIKFASSHPGCGAFGGKVVLDWEVTPSPVINKYSRTFAAFNLGESSKQLTRSNFHIPGAGLVVRRTALEKSGWLVQQFLTGRAGTKLTAGDDSEIVLRILNAGYELWYTPDCLLHHFIPARRITEKYLIDMNYGFGIAAPYIASLRWNRSYLMWLAVSIIRILKYLGETLVSAIAALINSDKKIEALITWKWTKGQLDSLLTILMMRGEERKTWLTVFN